MRLRVPAKLALAVAACMSSVPAGVVAEVLPPAAVAPLLRRACGSCHAAGVAEGGLDLDTLGFDLANPAVVADGVPVGGGHVLRQGDAEFLPRCLGQVGGVGRHLPLRHPILQSSAASSARPTGPTTGIPRASSPVVPGSTACGSPPEPCSNSRTSASFRPHVRSP